MNTHPESRELWQLAESSATVAHGQRIKNGLVARKNQWGSERRGRVEIE